MSWNNKAKTETKLWVWTKLKNTTLLSPLRNWNKNANHYRLNWRRKMVRNQYWVKKWSSFRRPLKKRRLKLSSRRSSWSSLFSSMTWSRERKTNWFWRCRRRVSLTCWDRSQVRLPAVLSLCRCTSRRDGQSGAALRDGQVVWQRTGNPKLVKLR